MKRMIITLLIGIALGSGAITAHADETQPADSSITTTTTPQETYASVSKLTKVDYYTTMGSHNYSVYKTGAYKTSASNMTAIATASKFANKTIHITREEVADGVNWLKFTYNHTTTGWVQQKATVQSTYRLVAPLIAQRPQLPTGCEITATAMMLQFGGAKVTKLSLAKEMPRSTNPNKGFVGSPYKTSGWYIYPGGLMNLVKKHMGSSRNMTRSSLTSIKQQVRRNHLVVVWVGNFDGFSNHALTVTGYSSSRIYYNDPWTDKRSSVTNSTMTKHRKADAYRALSY